MHRSSASACSSKGSKNDEPASVSEDKKESRPGHNGKLDTGEDVGTSCSACQDYLVEKGANKEEIEKVINPCWKFEPFRW